MTLRVRPGVGTPLQIKGDRLQAPVKGLSGDSALETALAFLRSNRQILRLENPDQELRLTQRSEDELSLRHLKFEQRYRGLSVWPAELIVHLDEGGNVNLLDGAYVPTPRRTLLEPIVKSEVRIDLQLFSLRLNRNLLEGTLSAAARPQASL